ncbi:hypothetical protein A7U43_27680 (plasmid) [Mycobacterium adipatum]|uniref:Uncharacterized protein n=1 Tax=Mycobacterium adipatum TaxID=1682113 RepID=A0A172UW80_9MYCO|nr:hypothetical protein [Mycobacterium adipatum]ANE83326.1 hypothetical protein A7U43_27680 [Mycobacterium adipatum]
MIGGLVRVVARQARMLVLVAVLAGAANHYLGIPVSVTLGYALVGWWLWVALRVPVRMVRRHAGGRPAR